MDNDNRLRRQAKYNEADAALEIERLTGRRVLMLPAQMSPIDFVISDSTVTNEMVTHIGEFRCRPDLPREKFRTFVMTKSKVDKMRRLAEMLGVYPIIIVKWQDEGLWWCDARPDFKVVHNFERNMPEREDDKPEAIYHIPISGFQPVGGI